MGKRTDIPFKKVEITPAVWVALAPDKLMLGGNFLPAEMHLTLSFGVRSGWFDLHMTKNCDGRGLHAPLIKVPRADVESLGDLTIRWVGRTVFGSMADADLRAMAARRAVLLLLPETDDEDPELGEAAKANFGHLVGRRGAGKYRIDLDDPKFKAAIDGLVEPGAPIQNWLHGRLFRPSVLRNLPGRAGVVYDQGRAAALLSIPTEAGKHRVVRLEAESVLDQLKAGFLASRIGTPLAERWEVIQKRLAMASSPDDLRDILPIEVRARHRARPVGSGEPVVPGAIA